MKLPPLLEARRKKYGIPDGAFRQLAAFDRALLWQIPLHDDDDTYKGTMIVMSEKAKRLEKETAPRGVVVTAGLEALDYFWAHGIELGSIVKFVRLSPWKIPFDIVDGKEQSMHVVRAGDCVASEDIAPGFYSGDVKIVRGDDGVHRYEVNGVVRERYQPQPSDDY